MCLYFDTNGKKSNLVFSLSFSRHEKIHIWTLALAIHRIRSFSSKIFFCGRGNLASTSVFFCHSMVTVALKKRGADRHNRVK